LVCSSLTFDAERVLTFLYTACSSPPHDHRTRNASDASDASTTYSCDWYQSCTFPPPANFAPIPTLPQGKKAGKKVGKKATGPRLTGARLVLRKAASAAVSDIFGRMLDFAVARGEDIVTARARTDAYVTVAKWRTLKSH
jgi:hypothetical protein